MKFISEQYNARPHKKNKFLEYLDLLPELGTIAHLYKNKKEIPNHIDSYAWHSNGIHNFTTAKKIINTIVAQPQRFAHEYVKIHGDNQKAYDAIRNFYPSLPKQGKVKEFFDIIGDKPFNIIHPIKEEKEDVIFESNNGTTPFMDAIRKQQYNKLNFYIDVLGVDPSEHQRIIFGDKIPLSVAADQKIPDVFNFLVSKEARINTDYFSDQMLNAFLEEDTLWLEAYASISVNPKKIVYHILGVKEKIDAYDIVNSLDRGITGQYSISFEEKFKQLQCLIQIQPEYKETIITLLQDLRPTEFLWLNLLPETCRNHVVLGNSEIDALIKRLQENSSV